jgi:hypothetical protein
LRYKLGEDGAQDYPETTSKQIMAKLGGKKTILEKD